MSSLEEEHDVEQHNAALMWDEVYGHLDAAKHELELVQGLLEDLRFSERVDVKVVLEHVDRFIALAKSEAESDTSLRPRPGESAADTIERVVAAVRRSHQE